MTGASMQKKKICTVIGSRANYSSIKSAMRAIRKHPELELQLVCVASALLDRYGQVVTLIERDGFHVVATLAQGEAGTPIRVVSILAAGQRVVLSTPQQAGAIEISRNGDSVLVRKANAATN